MNDLWRPVAFACMQQQLKKEGNRLSAVQKVGEAPLVMSGFMSIFGQGKTMKQMVRQQKRSVDKSIRELERERMGLERQEKKLVMEIKKMAKKNQLNAVNVMAKDLVRIR